MHTIYLKECIEIEGNDVDSIDCHNYCVYGDHVSMYGQDMKLVGILPTINVKAILEKGKIKVGEHPETEKSDVIDIITKLSYEAEGLDETIEKLLTIKRLMDEIGLFAQSLPSKSTPCPYDLPKAVTK